MNFFCHRSEQIYGFLLFIYGRKFRSRFGQELLLTFSDSLHEACHNRDAVGAFRVWWMALSEMPSVLIERLRRVEMSYPLFISLACHLIMLGLAAILGSTKRH